MRYKACKEAGLKEVPVIIADLTEEKQREFLIKDNVSG
jgi:ParB-like chromosome segregation protein Spo0J